MFKEGIDKIEMFALPIWLMLVAFLFGLLVSLAASLYPASSVARVNPADAIRNN